MLSLKAISPSILSSLAAFWKEMSETQKNCHSRVELHKLPQPTDKMSHWMCIVEQCNVHCGTARNSTVLVFVCFVFRGGGLSSFYDSCEDLWLW